MRYFIKPTLFYGNLVTIWWKKITFRNVKVHPERNWQTQVEKSTNRMEKFSPVFHIGAKKIAFSFSAIEVI